jgi:hypothetical protein
MGRKFLNRMKEEPIMRNPALLFVVLISALAFMLVLKSFVLAQVPTQQQGAAGASNLAANDPAMMHVMGAMESGAMRMGGHMKMTALRPLKPGDEERAHDVAERTRKAIEKYQDYKVALADGYRIFLPNVPQPMYHFSNYWYGFKAGFQFDPEHPTSLLYEKSDDGGYKLIGAMFTAPARFTPAQLDERVPLSVAQWHQHVNFCQAPKGREDGYFGPHPRFGLRGSITNARDCAAAGGTFHPVVFGWMVHVYPFERDPKEVWSVERQMAHAD